MPSIKDFYKIKLLAAKEMAGKVINGEITDVYPETPTGADSDGKPKLVVELNNGDVRVQLNKTNAIILQKGFGDDTNSWIGKTLYITTHKTTMNGKACDGLLVSITKPKK